MLLDSGRLSFKHLFSSAKADGTDVTLVKPSNWNAQHSVTTDSSVPIVLGATAPGPITELPISSIMPTGVMVDYAGATAPAGWLLCYGQPVSRVTYAALFAAIGTTYGAGDGSTTFNVPDLRGAVAAGASNMGGPDRGNLPGGGTVGAYIGAPSVGGLPAVNSSGGISGTVSVRQPWNGRQLQGQRRFLRRRCGVRFTGGCPDPSMNQNAIIGVSGTISGSVDVNGNFGISGNGVR